MSLFGHSLRHPLYPGLKLVPAVRATTRYPALTGTFRELTDAAAAGAGAERGVFPVNGAVRPFLEDEQREALWALFGVPVLVILLDGRGRVMGWECEVQDGFHFAQDHHAGLLFGTVETATCECGRPGPRLLREPAARRLWVPVGA